MFAALFCAAVLLAPNASAADKDAKVLAKLQGDWESQSSEIDGRVVPARRPAIYTFKGNEYVATNPDGSKSAKVAFKIDTSKEPMHYDPTSPSGKLILGIFKVEGDKLTVCLNVEGMRPTSFNTKGASGSMTIVYKRVKK